jgi:hypothetical protein
MRAVPTGEFKATCLRLLEEVRSTRRPLPVTKRGKTVAEIRAPADVRARSSWLGCMRGTGRTVGDIVAPAAPATECQVLRR